eukprot:1120230-Pyramimonas_sp.AAC.1
MGTNRGRRERIYPQWAQIAESEREYTHSGHQSRQEEGEGGDGDDAFGVPVYTVQVLPLRGRLSIL